MAFLDYIELIFSWLTQNLRNHDARLFTKSPAFAAFAEPTIAVTSPSCGPSGSTMQPQYTQVGADHFPTLTWSNAPPDTAEYILVVEDADMPLPGPIAQRVFHGLYYSMPATTTGVSADDFETVRVDERGGLVKGGWRFTKNVRGVAYAGPRPVLGHGSHRYFYQLVGLREPLDLARWGDGAPSKKELAEAVEGKVVGWGVWVGLFERKWGEVYG